MTIDMKDAELYQKVSTRSFVELIPLSDLTVDPALQRTMINPRRINTMVKEFDADALGVLEVSRRLSGMNHVLDGYHRLKTMREMRKIGKLPEDFQVTCKVFVGLSVAEEARLFALLNSKEKVSRIDLFRIKMMAQDPAALDINRILEENKWTVKNGAGKGVFNAVAAVEIAYGLHPISAEKAVKTLTRAWDNHTRNVNGLLITGLSMFYRFYGNAVDLTELAGKMTKFKVDGNAYLAAARSRQDMTPGSVSNSVASLTHEVYNVDKRTKGLPDWVRNGKRDPKAPPVVNTLTKSRDQE